MPVNSNRDSIELGARLIGEAKRLDEGDLDDVIDKLLVMRGLPKGRHQLPEELRSWQCAWTETLQKMYEKEIASPASLSPDQGNLLRLFVKNVRPKTLLEIGCYIGISAMWMAYGLEEIGDEGVLHSVDLFEDIDPTPLRRVGLKAPKEFVVQAFRDANLAHRVKLHQMDSAEMADRIHELVGSKIDLLFLDADHSIEGCLDDFLRFYPHVTVGGYVVLHDTNPKPSGADGPRHLIDNIIRKSSLFQVVEVDTSPHNFGMALVRKTG